MSSDIAIKVENLSKCFHIYDQPRDRLKQFVLPRCQQLLGLPAHQYFREFWALQDVSLEVKRGETVGIVGRNGSGKSTLLQIICGTLSPTSGTVQANGRIAALLELGSGFNPEFTGRENVYMNAAVLGLRKDEIDARYDDILAFADIGEFINQPVKTYSSGMMVRLAFALQAQIDPDILIVDEALAVGDARFQARCFDRLRQLKDNGTSILLVTHASEQIVTHCSHAVLMSSGQVLEAGAPKNVVNRYLDLLFGKERQPAGLPVAAPSDDMVQPALQAEEKFALSTSADVFSTRPNYNQHEYRWGDGSAHILDFCLVADGKPYPSAISIGQNIQIALSVRFAETLVRPILGVTIKTKEGVTVYGANTETLDTDTFKSQGQTGTVARVKAEFISRLAPGDYFVSLGIATRKGEDVVPHDRRYDAVHLLVRPDSRFFGLADLDLTITSEAVPS